MQDKKILTTGEIAEYCGVNFRTVIRWVERGLLKAYQLPGRGDNRVEVSDFLDFLKKNNMPIPKEFQKHMERILIMDDEPEMAKSIQRVLRQQGYETMIANDGFRAGSLLTLFEPAVLTLDLQMPGVGGLEVLKFIREKEEFNRLKILVISAMPDKELQAALTAGADDILEKPFDNQILIQKIQHLSGLKSTH